MMQPATQAMTCTECLSAVATGDVLELTTTTAVTEHCRSCPECAGVIDEVAREERRLADTLDGMPPGVPAQVIALRAVAGSARSRRRSRRLRIALGVLGIVVAPALPLLLLRGDAADAAEMRTRTVELHCLSPEHAMVLVPPALPRDVARGIGIEVSPHGLPVITVSGTPRDLAAAEQVIARIDARWGAERSEYCAVAPRAGAPAASAPTAGRPVPTTVVTPPGPPRAMPR